MKGKKSQKNDDISTKKHSKAKKFKAKPKKDKKVKLVQPHLPKSASEISSNWLALKQVLSKENNSSKSVNRPLANKKVKRLSDDKKLQSKASSDSSKRLKNEIWFDDVDEEDIERSRGINAVASNASCEKSVDDLTLGGFTGLTKRIAIDCEFVGVGRDGKRNMLARVSIVNSHCGQIYDKFVTPQEMVTDYRTSVSGIRDVDLENAPDFKTVQKEISDILKGRILVGHAVKNDLKVLLLDHPKKDIRDTAKYKPFHKIAKSTYPSLKKLSQQILHTKIQEGEHSSVQDAQAAMRLYILHKRQWEKQIQEKKFKPKAKTTENDDS